MDHIFPLYVPLNPAIEINRQSLILEKLFKTVPPIYHDKNNNKGLIELLKDIKNKEKKKANSGGNTDFDKINIIDDFLELRASIIAQEKIIKDKDKLDATSESLFEKLVEDEFIHRLCLKIEQNITRRVDH